MEVHKSQWPQRLCPLFLIQPMESSCFYVMSLTVVCVQNKQKWGKQQQNPEEDKSAADREHSSSTGCPQYERVCVCLCVCVHVLPGCRITFAPRSVISISSIVYSHTHTHTHTHTYTHAHMHRQTRQNSTSSPQHSCLYPPAISPFSFLAPQCCILTHESQILLHLQPGNIKRAWIQWMHQNICLWCLRQVC